MKDLELIDACFEEASNLTPTEKSTLYYISGYITRKENMLSINPPGIPPSEFTNYLSRGSLSHPPADLFDLSLYLFSFFKRR